MAVRRMIMGLRGGVFGMWVALPGWDAETAPESSLIFSTTRRHGQAIASGTFVCPSGGAGLFVSFGRTAPVVPLLFCGRLTQFPSTAPVRCVVTTTGFTAYARQIPGGTYPAGGVTMRWYACLKNQD